MTYTYAILYKKYVTKYKLKIYNLFSNVRIFFFHEWKQ